MVGAVKAVGFSWDGSFVVGGSDEGNGLEIVRSAFFSYEPIQPVGIFLVLANNEMFSGKTQAHVETGEYVYTVPTTVPAPCVAWHPSKYWLAYSGDPMGLKIVGAGGGSL